MMADDVRVSHPDKVFYPDSGLTKGDVVEYYRAVADVMAPHLRGRPLTLRRYPDGIAGKNWVQKEASSYFAEWIRIEKIPQYTPGPVRPVVCDAAATLVYL